MLSIILLMSRFEYAALCKCEQMLANTLQGKEMHTKNEKEQNCINQRNYISAGPAIVRM